MAAPSKDLAPVAARVETLLAVNWQEMLERIRGQFDSTNMLDRVSCNLQESRPGKRVPTWWQEARDTSEYGKVWCARGRRFRREYLLCGDGGDIHEYLGTARQAGEILLLLPSRAPEIWKEIYAPRWPQGAMGNDFEQLWPLTTRWEHPGWLWCDVLFELAWQPPRGRPLRAERRDVGHDKKETRSELNHLKHASSAAIDYLLYLARMNGEPRSTTRNQPESNHDAAQGDRDQVRTRPRKTAPGDAKRKIIAALTEHHDYQAALNGSVGNQDPIGCNELAKLADVSIGAASGFFKVQFDSHARYKAACREVNRLVSALLLLNQDIPARVMLRDPEAVAEPRNG